MHKGSRKWFGTPAKNAWNTLIQNTISVDTKKCGMRRLENLLNDHNTELDLTGWQSNKEWREYC